MISKLIPINTAISLAMKFGLLRKPLELLAGAFRALDGKKSEVGIVAVALIYAAAFFNLLPWDVAHQLASYFTGASALALGERIKKHEGVLRKVSEAASEAAKKP